VVARRGSSVSSAARANRASVRVSDARASATVSDPADSAGGVVVGSSRDFSVVGWGDRAFEVAEF